MLRKLAAALAFVVLSAAPALAAKPATLTAYDTLALSGSTATTARFKVERKNLIRWDLEGVSLDYWIVPAGGQTWQYLGRARSGRDGYADLRFTAPAAAGDYVVAAKTAPGGRYESGYQYLFLGVRARGARIIVTDIDWTIAAVDWDKYLTTSNANVRPVNGAVQALTDMAKDATVVYLTARDDYFGNKTRSWVQHWSFPRGPVICSDGLTMFRDPTSYKTAAIRAIKAMFPDVPAGFGNKSTDHAAYAANGLHSYQWTTETTRLPAGAHVYKDWEDLRAAVRRGERPELAAWARSFR